MSKWYSFEELKRARTPMPLDSVTGLPDNHVITVVERVISVDNSELIQNNVRTDTVTLDLDAEYDDLNVIIIFTKPNNINVQVAYSGQPVHIPGSVMELTGSVAVSVVGLDAEGETRAVTKAAPDTFQVVASGAYTGKISQDDVDLLGQILQAVSDTETAITAAETATTAATNATSQATSAATSANQAASSANTAASSANSAATKANSAAVDAQNAYDTLQPYMATIDSCANILHREVGPDAVVTADDSFPAKPVEMVVYGNTVQNLWVNPSGTNVGVTATANDDGSVTLSGTSTAYSINDVETYILKPGSTYTASIDGTLPSGVSFRVRLYDSDEWVRDVFSLPSGSATFTIPNDGSWTVARFAVVVPSGTTVSGTYRVMLNEGSEAQPWCPPGLNSVGQLRDDEKNLWVNVEGSSNGVSVVKNDDGSMTVSGTNTQGLIIQKPVSGLKPNTTYYLDWDRDLPIGYFCVGINGGVAIKSSRGTFTTGSDVSNLVCAFVITSAQGTATFSGTYKVMLNEGSTAHPWVAPGTESAVRVVTAGKNLFTSFQDTFQIQGENSSNQTKNIGFKDKEIPIGSKVIFSFDYRLSSGGGLATIQQFRSPYTDLGVFYSALSGDNTWHKKTGSVVTLDIDDMSINTYHLRLDNVTGLLDVKNFQLELGSTATDYEPPNITTTSIDLQGHTLNALPDGTRDELHIDGGGNVVLEKRCGDRVVDGTNLVAVNLFNDGKEARVPIGDSYFVQSSGDKSDKILSDKLPSYDPDVLWITKPRNGCAVAPSNQISARCNDMSTISVFNQYFQQNNMRVVYRLAEPQTIDLGTITPPTMAAQNVTAYVVDDTPAEIELDYVRDINIVVDRLEKKVADLVVTEATYV